MATATVSGASFSDAALIDFVEPRVGRTEINLRGAAPVSIASLGLTVMTIWSGLNLCSSWKRDAERDDAQRHDDISLHLVDILVAKGERCADAIVPQAIGTAKLQRKSAFNRKTRRRTGLPCANSECLRMGLE
jgi:hypothetical protein